MAETWKRRQLRHEAEMYQRLHGELVNLAASISQIVLRTAGRDGQIANRRSTRERLSRDIWQQAIKPYFVGPGDDPLIGPIPQSLYMRLIVEGIRGSIRIQAERQIAIIQKLAPDDVTRWLTGPRLRATVQEIGGGDRRLGYDPFHLFVNPNGYRLSDNGWNTAIRCRAAVDNLLAYEIPRGTAAVDIAKKLEPYLWPEAAKVRTKTPYGSDGSYWARRLARTEITAAAGRSTVNASLGNPYVELLRWVLSLSHPEPDICDDNAHGGPESDGRYPKNNFPPYPGHPHCVTPGQLVQTDQGCLPIESIQASDRVVTHTGQYRTVLKAWSRPFDGPVYKFFTEYGSFELTGEHPVLLERGWVNAQDVQPGEKVLYAGVNIPFDLVLSEADYDPALLTHGGIAPRSASVERFMRPFQALPHYTTIRAIEVRHYEGPVFNMHVDGDNSYTVNGACVHNCLCTIVPEVTATPAQVTAHLRDTMQAGPVDGERYAQREQLQGAFNLDWLIEALLMGYFLREVVGEEEQTA